MQRALAVVLLASACGGDDGPAPADAPPVARCEPTAAFGQPELLAGLSTDLDEVGARLSADELTVWFARRNTAGNYDLWTATRPSIDAELGAPTLLTTVNSSRSEVWPTVSPTGTILFFDADRTTPGTFHLWSSTRADATAAFGPPTSRVEMMDGEGLPYLATDTALYFVSAVRPSLGATDLWRAPLENGVLGVPATVVGGVNGPDPETAPVVTTDERTIYFRRTVTPMGGAAESDVYTATRTTPADGFGAATVIPTLADPGIEETPTWVSDDGCVLYVTRSARVPGEPAGTNLYVARRPAS